MTAASGALIPPTANPLIETALQDKLRHRQEAGGTFGELGSLALRLGLIRNSLHPSFDSARIVVFAADHGLAVDTVVGAALHSTAAEVSDLLADRIPLGAFARQQGMELTVVDSGVAQPVIPNARLLARKIAHGTRHSGATAAMSLEQAHAAMRAGMEIGHGLGGDAVACAGMGLGSTHSAALLLSCLSGTPSQEFLDWDAGTAVDVLERLLLVLEGARQRHGHLADPVELLAAVGGFEVAMMTGLMLAAASRRRLILVDGIPACAALLVAAAIAPAAPDYCIHVRSNRLVGLDRALALLGARAVLDLGIDSVDGTGAVLAWPLVRYAAALLADVAESGGPAVKHSAPALPATAAVSQR